MKKSTKLHFLLLTVSILCLSCCSCSVNKNPKNQDDIDDIPSYQPDVQWTLETNVCGGSALINQYGQYLYYIENPNDVDDKKRIVKVDLENGDVCWKTDLFDFISDSYSVYTVPVKCGDYIFIVAPEEDVLISEEYPSETNFSTYYCFDDMTGKLSATITFAKSELEKHVNGDIFAHSLYSVETENHKYLVWGHDKIPGDSTSLFGIYKFDISKIDFTKAPKEKQYCKPEYCWGGKSLVYTMMTANDGIIYFQTYASENRPSIIYAVDVETNMIQWMYESEIMTGRGVNALSYVNDEENKIKNCLFCFEDYAGCYNAKTGKMLWENSDPNFGGVIYNEGGVFYDDGKFFYTTIHSDMPNILCMNAKTGKNEWGYCIKNSGSLFTRPIVANGKVFVLSWGQGLWVFDENDGAVIGCDDSVFSGGDDANAYWNDKVIYFDFHNQLCENATLIAIRP